MRWLKILAAGLFVITGLAAAGVWFTVQRSLPDYDTTLISPDISAQVEIIRTNNAIPHIFGSDDRDVFFGLGYAHAQDRLWQMEIFRRTARGRLSELLGQATVSTDELLLRFDLMGAAEQSVEDQDAYARAVLDAYSAGINARIAETTGWGKAAPEFLLFPTEIAPWQPADSLAIMKLLALQLASHVDREVLRARVSHSVSPARLKDIQPDDPNPGIATWPAYSQIFPTLPANGIRTTKAAPALFLNGGLASNAWAAGASRSESGKPILANDTHLNFSAPSSWYLTRLELASGAVIGGTIPGIPAILSGRNADVAWALTAANMDDQDVFIEQLNPDNPDEVLTPTGYRSLRTGQATIPVNGAEPVQINLQWSENGPIVPGRYYNLRDITPPGHVASIARTLFDQDDTSLSAALKLLRARSVDEAIVAMDQFVTPAQNLSMVDRDTIALQMIGKMPRRNASHTTKGRMPSQGWLAVNRWDGYLPYDLNPRFVDPVGDVLGNTNSRTLDRAFPEHVSFDWGDTQRIQHLKEVLQSRELHSQESFMAGHMDAVSYPAKTILPKMLALVGADDPLLVQVKDELAQWNKSMDLERADPLIFAAWMRQFQTLLIQDELGDLAQAFTHAKPVFLNRVLGDVEGAAIWCDDVSTGQAESCSEIATISLTATLDNLANLYGDNPDQWQWGQVHIATHDHPVLGTLPVIGSLVNIRQPTGGGDNTLLRGLTNGKGDTPLTNHHGALYRSVVDMANPDASVFVISTGQSGHPLSRHYRDIGKLWLHGGYASMSFDKGKVLENSVGTTHLMPQ